MAKLTVLGGSRKQGVLGPSCYIIDDLMIDCGIGFSRNGKNTIQLPPDLSRINKTIKSVMVTHSHFDHVGAIPVLRQKDLIDFDTQMWASAATSEITNSVLTDDSERTSLYSGVDLMLVPDFKVIQPGEFEPVPGIRAYAIPNGHIYGSYSFIIKLKSGRKGLITGDWSSFNQSTVQGMLPVSQWPDEWLPDEIWGSDFTHGSILDTRLSSAFEAEQMVKVVKAAREAGKFVRIFGFANGRIHNAALHLAAAGIPCYIDSTLALKIWDVYQRDGVVPALGDASGIYPVEGWQHREALINSSEPNVILATSGMGDMGPSFTYECAGLPREDHFFAATSWLAPGCPMDQLVSMQKEFPVYEGNESNRVIALYNRDRRGNETTIDVPVRASIGHFRLSSHSSYSDMLIFLGELIARRGDKLDRMVLSHGSTESLEAGRTQLMQYVKNEKDIVLGYPGTEIDLDRAA